MSHQPLTFFEGSKKYENPNHKKCCQFKRSRKKNERLFATDQSDDSLYAIVMLHSWNFADSAQLTLLHAVEKAAYLKTWGWGETPKCIEEGGKQGSQGKQKTR